MSEHNYIIGYQNAAGEFDVIAKFRDQEPLNNEKLKAVIREVLRNGTIIRDSNGKHHLIEEGKARG